jgi:N-acetyl-anhydromuramyl-L-alanine amidase AmpD
VSVAPPLWLAQLAATLRGIFPPGVPSGLPDWSPPGTQFHDRRDTASRSQRKGARPWRKVTGVCLHQTACLLGERPARWDTVGAHLGITRGGQVILLHPFDRVVWHGNGFNAQTVGIEIDGLYAGLEGVPRTVWNDPSTPHREQGMDLPEVQADAARQVIRWICAEVEANGGKVSALVAHRQSSESRQSDPGSAIWQRVALPIAAELGLSDGGDGFKLGDGRAIPREWDLARTARY